MKSLPHETRKIKGSTKMKESVVWENYLKYSCSISLQLLDDPCDRLLRGGVFHALVFSTQMMTHTEIITYTNDTG